jgi:hypothetical protein
MICTRLMTRVYDIHDIHDLHDVDQVAYHQPGADSRRQVRCPLWVAPQAHWRLDSWPRTYESVRFHARACYGRC